MLLQGFLAVPHSKHLHSPDQAGATKDSKGDEARKIP